MRLLITIKSRKYWRPQSWTSEQIVNNTNLHPISASHLCNIPQMWCEDKVSSILPGRSELKFPKSNVGTGRNASINCSSKWVPEDIRCGTCEPNCRTGTSAYKETRSYINQRRNGWTYLHVNGGRCCGYLVDKIDVMDLTVLEKCRLLAPRQGWVAGAADQDLVSGIIRLEYNGMCAICCCTSELVPSPRVTSHGLIQGVLWAL